MSSSCLVIDDSETVRQITADLVEGAGASVRQAGTPAEALSLIAEYAPDILFLDWDLPNGGALDVIRAVTSHPAPFRPQIVLCLMEYDPAQLASATVAGVRHHILKPYAQRDIVFALNAIASERAGADIQATSVA